MYSALSNEDIMRVVPNLKFYQYSEIHKLKMYDLLPYSLILYQPMGEHRIGHFVCIFDNSEGINFFDPFGNIPDIPLEWGRGYHSKYHNYTYLTRLLYQASKHTPIIYNEYPLQDIDTSTCGHWCAIRLIYRKVTNDAFFNSFKHIKNKDDMIVRLYKSFL